MAKVIDDTREGELSQQVEALVIKLSASEKRAEEAEARTKLDRETLQAREMLGGALGMDMNECVVEATKRVCKQYERERDEARSDYGAALRKQRELLSERDEARSSLARVVEDAAAMAEARADSFIKTGAQIGWAERENWAENMRNLAKDIRSALHRSQGE